MMSRMRQLGVVFAFLLISAIPALAQNSTRATLSPPNTEHFPRLSAYLDVRNAQGVFLHGLRAGDVQISENGRRVPVATLSELRPGVQFVLAINPGQPFAIRNVQGTSRYELLATALSNWALRRRGATVDDLSLIITAGPVKTHFANSDELSSMLGNYEFDARAANASLDTLFQAVDIAADPTPRVGMERAVLFVTAPLDGDVTFPLQNLIARARQQQVRVYVWMVSSAELFTSQQAEALRDLARQTEGQFFAFSGIETLPSPENYLAELRDVYHLTYDSLVKTSGAYELVAEIRRDGEVIRSSPLEFEIDLQPPDPVFINPAIEISRRIPSAERQNFLTDFNNEALSPDVQEYQIMVEFPDGRERALVRTRLYVDGEVAAENTAPPFDRFWWKLDRYTTSGQHLLQVEAIDSLGLSGKSIETLVEVVVERPALSPFSFLAKNWLAITGLVTLISAAIVLLVLIWGGRIRPHALRVPLGFRRRQRDERAAAKAPALLNAELARSVKGGRRIAGWVNRLQWPQRRLAMTASAYLVPVNPPDVEKTEAPVPIIAEELTLGRDKKLATLILDDPSVSALHARLVLQGDDVYCIFDEGSVAGTWVNYARVAPQGCPLIHGDIIHLGRTCFRFQQRQPARVRKPVITPLEEAPK